MSERSENSGKAGWDTVVSWVRYLKARGEHIQQKQLERAVFSKEENLPPIEQDSLDTQSHR